jgi:hypothetical protein
MSTAQVFWQILGKLNKLKSKWATSLKEHLVSRGNVR